MLLIDGENISHNKAESIVNAARLQGTLFESRVYGRQKDSFTRGWTGKARECGIQDIRLFGEPEKDKADKKIQKDARRLVVQNKNVDVVCLATSDSGYIETIEKLRLQGKKCGLYASPLHRPAQDGLLLRADGGQGPGERSSPFPAGTAVHEALQ